MSNYYGFAAGQEFELRIVLEDTPYLVPFCVTNEGLVSLNEQMPLTDLHELTLAHTLFKYQRRQSRAFNDTTSHILAAVLSDLEQETPLKFTSKALEETADAGRWFCPNLTESEFLTKLLLPSMYGGDTPYYCFVTNNNEVILKSWHSLWNQKPALTFKLAYPPTLASDGSLPIFNMNPLQMGYGRSLDAINQLQFYLDEDGRYQSKKFKDGLDQGFKNKILAGMPVKSPSEAMRSQQELLDYDVDAGNADSINGALDVNTLKPLLSQEKLLVTVPLNPTIVSGEKVKVEISQEVGDSTDFMRYTGEYLIEKSFRQVGNGVAWNTCILSRPGKKIPDSVLLKKDFAFSK